MKHKPHQDSRYFFPAYQRCGESVTITSSDMPTWLNEKKITKITRLSKLYCRNMRQNVRLQAILETQEKT